MICKVLRLPLILRVDEFSDWSSAAVTLNVVVIIVDVFHNNELMLSVVQFVRMMRYLLEYAFSLWLTLQLGVRGLITETLQ